MLMVDHVFKEYRRGRSVIRALENLSFCLPKGEFCVIMGPSGSGKSTLLNLIGGLDDVTSGNIVINGSSTQGFSDKEWTKMRREVLGMVFQAFHLVPGLTAEENVALPLVLAGESSSVVKARVSQCLNMVGLEERSQHRPSELSGGEQQRVAIARAIVHRPKIILADEPTGNLDSHNAEEVVKLLRQISQNEGQTVVLATHWEAAAKVADRRLELRDGHLCGTS